MGRALADVDPGGVGRDVMFRLDGQSSFSVFPVIAAWLVAHSSLAVATMTLVVTSSALWFVAGLDLTRRIATDGVWSRAAIAFVAPAFYGGFNILKYAEALAEPRPLAEAFVIFAIAAFLRERRLIALLLLVLAALFHPLMAGAGMATLYFCLCAEDRRWIVAGAGGLAAVIVGAAFGAPLVARLAVIVDPVWRNFLIDRNAYLFPQVWPSSDFILPVVQAGTILLAASYAEQGVRRVLLSALAAGIVGLAVAWFAAAISPMLLLLQTQTWRMWWLTGFAAALALGLCALRLGAGKPSEKVALAVLTLSWTCTNSWGAAALVIIALVLARPPAGLQFDVSDSIVRLAWIGVCCAVLAPAAVSLTHWNDLAATVPGFTPSLLGRLYIFAGDALLLTCVLLAAFGAPRALMRVPLPLSVLAAMALLAGAVALWNDAGSYNASLARNERQHDLERFVAADGEVLWIDASIEPWVWLGRPAWNTNLQGAGSVFSRELAMLYRERSEFLIADGLGDASLIKLYPNRRKTWHRPLTVENVSAVCRRADAPAYIIAPVRKDAALDPALEARLWTPPAVRVEPVFRDESIDFLGLDLLRGRGLRGAQVARLRRRWPHGREAR